MTTTKTGFKTMRNYETETDYCPAYDAAEIPEIETETLSDCLQDIAGGMRTDSRGFWIPDPPC